MEKRTLPKSDSALFIWSKAFVAAVAADASALGITPAMRDEAIAAHAAFAGAWNKAASPLTRTAAAVQGKNDAASLWRGVAAKVVAVVRAQSNLSDEERMKIGIDPRATNVRIGAPVEPPSLIVTEIDGHTVRLRIDCNTGTRRGRPADAAGLVLFSHVGDDAPNAISDWTYQGTSSATSLDLTFDGSLPFGQQVWFTAQWLSPRLEAGPLATPVSARLTSGLRTRSVGMRRAA